MGVKAISIGNRMHSSTSHPLDSAGRISLAWQELEGAARILLPEFVPAFLANLEKVRLIAFARLVAKSPAPEPDQLVGIAEAARRLSTSTSYLYRHHQEFSFTRHVGRKVLFSSSGLDRFIAARR